MRLLRKLFLILLILICILGLSVYFLVRTFDINKYKDQITQGLSKALNRPVMIGQLDFGISLAQGITLNAADLRIGTEQDILPEIFLKIKNISLGFDLQSFIKYLQILVTKIEINNPELNIIKETTNTALGANSGDNKSKSVSGTEGSIALKTETPKPGDFYSFKVREVRINNGVINFYDRDQDPEIDIPIKAISVSIDNFNLKEPFWVRLDCALWSDRANIHYQGRTAIDLTKGQMIFEKGEFDSDLSLLALERIQQSIPQSRSWGLTTPMGGKLDSILTQGVISPQGLGSLSLQGSLNNGLLNLVYLKNPIQNVSIQFTLDENNLIVSEFKGLLAGGKIGGKARINNYLSKPVYQIETDIADVQLEELIPDFHPEIKFKGKLASQISAKTEGRSEADIKNNLDGKVAIEVPDGVLLNVNLLKMVLSKISLIPDLVERIYENLSPKYKEQLKDKDTYFKSIKADLSLQNDGILIKSFKIDSDTFVLMTQGALNWDNNLMMSGQVTIPLELSQAMVSAVGELQYLMDESGIKLPLMPYKGPLASLRMMPNLEYIGKRLLVSKGKEELNKLLDKVFDRDTGSSNTTENESPDAKQPSNKISPEQQLIEGVLDAIFH